MTATPRRIVLPRDGSWFEGHFPGNPVLPGVAHLALLHRPADAVISLRLRSPLGPGDEVDIEEDAGDEPTRHRAVLRKGSEIASRMTVDFAETPRILPPSDHGRRSVAGAGVAGAEIASWIPHRPPILCLESLLAADENGASCGFRLPSEGAFVTDAGVPAFFSLECAAQATAVWEAARRRRHGGPRDPRQGFLVGAREAYFATTWFEAGASGLVHVQLTGAAPPLALYRFFLELDDREVANGTIQVWITATAS